MLVFFSLQYGHEFVLFLELCFFTPPHSMAQLPHIIIIGFSLEEALIKRVSKQDHFNEVVSCCNKCQTSVVASVSYMDRDAFYTVRMFDCGFLK